MEPNLSRSANAGPSESPRTEGHPLVRVLITDDHAILRSGLKEILMRELQGIVCGEAKDASEALDRIHNAPWDLVILDISMPGRSGLEVLRDLKAVRPKLPVLVLSMHLEGYYAKRCLRTGASGYVTKESAPEELIKAVQRVLAGGRYVSLALAEKLASGLSEDAGHPIHEVLSDRELEVLRMIATGKTVTNIADELHLGVTTVNTYRSRILEKLSMTTTAELIRYALHTHLID